MFLASGSSVPIAILWVIPFPKPILAQSPVYRRCVPRFHACILKFVYFNLSIPETAECPMPVLPNFFSCTHDGMVPPQIPHPSPFPHSLQPHSVESPSSILCNLSIYAIPPLSAQALSIYHLEEWLCLPASHPVPSKLKLGPVFSNPLLGLLPESLGSSEHAESCISLGHTNFPLPGVGPGNLCLPNSLNLRIILV